MEMIDCSWPPCRSFSLFAIVFNGTQSLDEVRGLIRLGLTCRSCVGHGIGNCVSFLENNNPE